MVCWAEAEAVCWECALAGCLLFHPNTPANASVLLGRALFLWTACGRVIAQFLGTFALKAEQSEDLWDLAWDLAGDLGDLGSGFG